MNWDFVFNKTANVFDLKISESKGAVKLKMVNNGIFQFQRREIIETINTSKITSIISVIN